MHSICNTNLTQNRTIKTSSSLIGTSRMFPKYLATCTTIQPILIMKDLSKSVEKHLLAFQDLDFFIHTIPSLFLLNTLKAYVHSKNRVPGVLMIRKRRRGFFFAAMEALIGWTCIANALFLCRTDMPSLLQKLSIHVNKRQQDYITTWMTHSSFPQQSSLVW